MPTFEKTVELALTEILKDKALFEKFEIPAKYERLEGQNIAVKVFDFWHNKFKELEKKSHTVEVEGNQILQDKIKKEFEKAFSDSYAAAEELVGLLKEFDIFIIKECRANIEFIKGIVSIMVLFDTKEEGKFPEDFQEYDKFNRVLYTQEVELKKKYPNHQFNCRALFYRDTTDIDTLRNDYPLFAKFPL
jgi:hypothetical protein